jgi:hypothetical protein
MTITGDASAALQAACAGGCAAGAYARVDDEALRILEVE